MITLTFGDMWLYVTYGVVGGMFLKLMTELFFFVINSLTGIIKNIF